MKERYSTYKSSELITFNEVPSHWNKNRIKYIGFMYGGLTGKSGDDFRKDEDDSTNKPFIPFTNICNNTYIKRDDLKLVSINEDDNQNRVEKDDLFFMMTSETQEDVGKTSVLKEDLGEVYLNTFCKGYRITDKSVNPYFLNYLLNGKPYREILSIEGNGFTRINLRQDRVNDFIVFTPPLPEQEQIVKFLDEKTSQIDNLISLTEKKIELLKQKRTSLINEVVTKGFNKDVELKDSGVNWIGEIPRHWVVKPLKYVVSCNTNSLPENTDPDYELDYVEISDVDSQGNIVNQTKYTFKESPSRCRRVLRKGDVFISTVRTYLKSIGYVKNDVSDLICSTGFCVLTPKKIKPEFLFNMVLNDWFISQVISKSEGVSYPSITSTELVKIKILQPPLPEQEQIVEYIDTHTSEIDKLVSIEQRRIETLKEYRQSLISEVVTGKIRVCEEVSELQEN